jgi:predicted dehydrogenase
MFDTLIGLTSLPTVVLAQVSNQHSHWDVEDTASVLMSLPDGAQVTASFSWCASAWRHELELVGSEATILWSPYDSGPVVWITASREPERLDLPPAPNVHQPLVENFVQAVLTGSAPACAIAEAVRTNQLLDAIYRSAAEHREVRLGAD